MANLECLRQKAGECGGCAILEIVKNQSQGKLSQTLVTKIAADYCPDGEQPVLPERVKQSIW